jgi:hypothetical protein
MALREIESTLPPGFRFYPSDEELVCHYLHKKVANERIAQGTLVEVDLHAREPWELPGQSVNQSVSHINELHRSLDPSSKLEFAPTYIYYQNRTDRSEIVVY